MVLLKKEKATAAPMVMASEPPFDARLRQQALTATAPASKARFSLPGTSTQRPSDGDPFISGTSTGPDDARCGPRTKCHCQGRYVRCRLRGSQVELGQAPEIVAKPAREGIAQRNPDLRRVPIHLLQDADIILEESAEQPGCQAHGDLHSCAIRCPRYAGHGPDSGFALAGRTHR